MSVKKPGFVVYHSNEPIVEALNVRQRGELLTALFEYSRTGTHTPCKGTVEAVFQVMRTGMDKDREKYERVCEQNKKRIRKRWDKNNPDTAENGDAAEAARQNTAEYGQNTEKYGENTEEYGQDTEKYGENTEEYGQDTEKYGEDTETIRKNTKLNRNKNKNKIETEIETKTEIETETKTKTETKTETEPEIKTNASYENTHTKRGGGGELSRKTEEEEQREAVRRVCESEEGKRVLFKTFWNLYPKKTEPMEEVYKVFRMRTFDEESYNNFIGNLQKAIASPQWHLENGRYIPRASVWLREHRDEPIVLPAMPDTSPDTSHDTSYSSHRSASRFTHHASEEPDEAVYERLRKMYLEETEREEREKAARGGQ